MNARLTFFLFLFSLQALAQHRLTGRVTDAANQSMSYATVALLRAADSTVVKGAITDESGRFTMDKLASGTYRTRISAVGYKDVYSSVVTLSAETPVADAGVLTLEASARNLAEVTVKAQPSLVRQQADRLVLNVEGSVITRGNKAEDLLRYIPRVRYEGGTISVGNKSNVLVQVDGRQMGQGSLASFLQTFSAEDIVRIEVITNPSARYDATVDAVVNIITKKSREQGISGRSTLTYSQGQYSRSSANGSLTLRQGKWTIFGSLNATLPSTAYSTQTLDRNFPGATQQNTLLTLNTYHSLATNLNADYAINARHVLSLRLNGNWRRGNTDTDTRTRSSGASFADSTIRTENFGREKTKVYDLNLSYKATLGSDKSKELTVFVTESLLDKDASQFINYQRIGVNDAADGPVTRLRILNPGQQRNLIGQLDYATPVLGKKWRLDVGTKYVFVRNDNTLQQDNFVNGQYQFDPTFSQSGLYQEHTYAAYSNLSRSWGKGWSWQGGLRIERTEQYLAQSALARTYAGLFPSMGLNRSLANGHSWGVTLSRKVSRPSLSILVPYRNLIDPYTIIEGNPMIRPSFAHTLDAFYALGSLNLFANYSYIRDQITTVLRADPATLRYTQVMDNLRNGNDFYVGATYAKNVTKIWQTNTTLMGMGNQTSTAINELSQYRATGLWVMLTSSNIISLPRDWKYELTGQYMSPARMGLFTQKRFGGVSMSLTKSLMAKQANLRIDVSDVFRTMASRLESNYGQVNFTMRSYNDSQRIKVSFSYNFGKKTVKAARAGSLGNDEEKSRMR
ncbi:outer membrane beta-barrel protein [Spirosoma pomorum]